jgi:sporulation protein YlmC with PRC-barrel domain
MVRAGNVSIIVPKSASIFMLILEEIPMSTFRLFGTAGALVIALAMPAIAQTQTAKPARTTTPAAVSTPAASTAPAGKQHQAGGMWRASTLVGATVYNQSGEAIGTITDLLIRTQGQVGQVVISVGGFLGIDTKLVELPFNRLTFETHAMATTKAKTGTSADASDYSVVLPDATKASLTKMPVFTFH